MATPTASRRRLRFEAIEQALAEADALVAAEAAGRLRCLGRWTPGQNLNHLATWVDYAYDGFAMKIPFFLRWFGPLMKRKMLAGPLAAGIRIPGAPGGTYAVEPVATPAAHEHFRSSFSRLAREAPVRPHPLLGPLTHEQWVALHLRHAELHLSFLEPS